MQHKAFSYYSVQDHAWVSESGAYEIRLGTSSTNIVLSKPIEKQGSFKWIGLEEPAPCELYH